MKHIKRLPMFMSNLKPESTVDYIVVSVLIFIVLYLSVSVTISIVMG